MESVQSSEFEVEQEEGYSKPITSHESVPYKTVTYSGEGDQYVIIDNKKYHRHELMQAFGGTFNPGLAPYPKHQFGNAAALGLCGTAFSAFIIGMFFANSMGIKAPNVGVGIAVFYGGLIQFLSGVWELAAGNTFAGTAFTSYGAFWLSFGSVFIPAFGIGKAYAEDPVQMNHAIGFFLLAWGIFTTILWSCTFKSTVAFNIAVGSLVLTFFVLASGYIADSPKTIRAGGIIAVAHSFVIWYNAFAGVATKENSYITCAVMPLKDYQS
ncbi:putative transporter [Scheffersomyces xylosifermentans]|uniref:putative transporter n=1 Tax=Scheffersomyces xylosifermentans TaxID=1304137 RepID=UPI00315D70C5